MAETLGADKKAPKKPAKPAKAADNVVALKPNSTTVTTGGDPASVPNMTDEERLTGVLYDGIADLNRYDEKIAAAQAVVAGIRGERKSVVAKMGAAGLPASVVKEAMDDLKNPRTDTGAKEKVRAFVRNKVQLPNADWADAYATLPTGAKEETDYEAMGFAAGVLAIDRIPPKDIPPERQPNWLAGYDKVMHERAMDMAPKGKKAPKSDEKPAMTEVEPGAEAPLILTEADFEPDTTLEDASILTLKADLSPSQRDHILSFDRVLVRFGARQRLIKEPGYCDDGTDEAGVSEIEDVAPEAAASFE